MTNQWSWLAKQLKKTLSWIMNCFMSATANWYSRAWIQTKSKENIWEQQMSNSTKQWNYLIGSCQQSTTHTENLVAIAIAHWVVNNQSTSSVIIRKEGLNGLQKAHSLNTKGNSYRLIWITCWNHPTSDHGEFLKVADWQPISINWLPASAGVIAGTSSLLGGR